MKFFYTSIIASLLLVGCASGRYNTNPTTGSVEKLIKKYNKKPEDTAMLSKLVNSYSLLNQQYLAEINDLKLRNTAQGWESIAGLYSKLNDLNNNAIKNADLTGLLQPADYSSDIAYAKLQSGELYYQHAIELLNENSLQGARKAYADLGRVKSLSGNYKDVAQLLPEAKEAGTLDIIVQPLRAEGLFVNAGYHMQDDRISQQLVTDMGGSWNNNQWYRTYTANSYTNSQDPDWVAEPVWTNWRLSPVQNRTYKREVTKQKEVGKDSLSKPVYKTISAVLTITETTISGEGTMELRLNDIKNQTSAGRTSWCETYTWKQTFATFKGDEDALSNDDLNLVRQQKERMPTEDKIQLQVLQKIYPDMLRWFRAMAG